AFGFRNFDNFKTRIFIALNMQKEKTISPPLGLSHKSPTTVDSEHFTMNVWTITTIVRFTLRFAIVSSA
ncbi:TPA: hypothetical protein ACKQ35_001917, partial [Streptococcus pyogenes]